MKKTQNNFHMTSHKLILVFFLSLASSFMVAQKNAIISGKVIDKLTSETVIGATVNIEGTSAGTVTDIEGNFKLTVVPGNYTLIIRYVGYDAGSVKVEAKANQVATVEYAMEEGKETSLKEVVVTATAERSSDVVMYIEVKKSPYIASGITGSEIRKTPDRTVGDILKRVTGASIQEGKFVIIRGMNDRYNAGYLDGALLSSTESDRKAFAFDFIPANLIDNLSIVKAGSPDLIGDFGGGVIIINTKSVPDKLVQSISLGAQYHSLTTFNDFEQFKSYPSEELNFINKSRAIPSFEENALKLSTSFPSAAEKMRLGDISKKFNNDWSRSTVTAVPNARFAYSLGFPIQLSSSSKLGVMFAVNYANTRKISENGINTFDGSGQVSGFTDKAYLRNINTGGIFNINYIGQSTQINFRNLVNVNSDFNTISRTGTGNFNDVLTVQNTANLLNYNRLYNGILSMKQLIGDSILTINASASYSNVHREVPDYRIASYTKTPDFDNYRLAIGDFFNSSTGRFESKLDENIYGATVELSKKFKSRTMRTEIKSGYFYQDRSRSFSARSFVYNGAPDELTLDPAKDLGPGNIDATKLYLVEKSSDDLAFYEGQSTMNAVYLMADNNYRNKIRAVYGVRFEDIDLKVSNHKINKTIADIKQMSFLPSLNLTYYLSQKTNVRGSYFSSVNRPEFRELAPFSFFVFEKNAEIRGNSDLKIATLQNFDFRYEFYPKGGQLISIGGFYKSIANPIELSLDVTQPFTTFTFTNEKSAKIYGLEFELKKKLDFINVFNLFQNISVYSNISLIKSKLDFNPGSQAKADRPLQGQSPYIFNARLQYENPDNGWSWNFSFNRVGRRIAFVGVDPKFGDTRQDIYEAPRSVVDFQLGKTINNINIKLTIGDLLHNNLIYYQDANHDGKYTAVADHGTDRLMYVFTNGYTTSLAFNYTF
ncbi:MAG: TonB-dependent receptor [Saprospiraceae bacterium]